MGITTLEETEDQMHDRLNAAARRGDAEAKKNEAKMGSGNSAMAIGTMNVLENRDWLAEEKPGGLAAASATDLARVLVAAHSRAQDLKAELDKVKKAKDELAELTIEALSREGVDGVKIGGFTVSAYVMVFPKFMDGFGKAQVCEALEACGNGSLVAKGYNSNTLASLIREMADPETGKIEMPDDLAKVLTTSEVSKISITKSKA